MTSQVSATLPEYERALLRARLPVLISMLTALNNRAQNHENDLSPDELEPVLFQLSELVDICLNAGEN